MNTFAERLSYALAERKLKQADIVKAGIASKGTVSNWYSGKNNPNDAMVMAKLAKLLKVSSEWLTTGEGSMIETSTQLQTQNGQNQRQTHPLANMKRAIDDPYSLPPALRDHFLAEHDDDPIDTDDAKAMLKRYVPVLSWVAAGDLTPVVSATLDDVIDWIPRPPKLSTQAFGLIVQGRSMLPDFKPDDIIYVEPETHTWSLKDGDLVVVSCDEDREATFKQLVIGDTSDDMYLKPLNPNWHNQEIRPMEGCRLVGKVVGKYVMF